MLEQIIKIQNKNGGYIRVKAFPKSTKTEISEILEDETIKIRIKAQAEKGKANEELLKFLRKLLNKKRGEISIVSGKTDQIKLIKII